MSPSRSSSAKSPAKAPENSSNKAATAAAAKKASVTAAAEPRVALPGSLRSAYAPPVGAPSTTRPSASRRITVSVLVRRRNQLPAATSAADLGDAPRFTRAQFRTQFGADPAAVKAVRAFAKQFDLTVAATPDQLAARTIQLTGTCAQVQRAFSVTLTSHSLGKDVFRTREGSIELPTALTGLVEAVLGLDNRPQASAKFRIAPAPPIGNAKAKAAAPSAAASSSFTPPQIASLYQFPPNASAAGQTIGLIELGGGYRATDITAYFSSLGLTAPTVTAVAVDGGKNSPSTADGADGEVMLDIEVAASVAPGSKIAVYFAPNTDQGFIDAITTAVHDTTNKPSVLSISWGGPESTWTQQAVTALDSACQAAALLGVTITVACGDNGSTDGVTDGADHVDFPASSPHVLACGGTKITAASGTLTNEVVWNELASGEGATGGGVSTLFPKPTWQASVNVPAASDAAGGRGLPDVSGDADPVTGYTVRVDGQTLAIGGTSAVAPLWAGLIALANAATKTPVGFINPTLYTNPTAFRDITSGNNGTFSASTGWDPCTGLGSPIGTAILSALGSSATTTGGAGTGTGGTGTGTGKKHRKHKKKT